MLPPINPNTLDRDDELLMWAWGEDVASQPPSFVGGSQLEYVYEIAGIIIVKLICKGRNPTESYSIQ